MPDNFEQLPSDVGDASGDQANAATQNAAPPAPAPAPAVDTSPEAVAAGKITQEDADRIGGRSTDQPKDQTPFHGLSIADAEQGVAKGFLTPEGHKAVLYAHADVGRPADMSPETWHSLSATAKQDLIANEKKGAPADAIRAEMSPDQLAAADAPPPGQPAAPKSLVGGSSGQTMVNATGHEAEGQLGTIAQQEQATQALTEAQQQKNTELDAMGKAAYEKANADQAKFAADHAAELAATQAQRSDWENRVRQNMAKGIDPSHYYSSRSTGQAVLDVIASALAGAIDPAHATEYMKNKINGDVEAQVANANIRQKGLDLEGQSIDSHQQASLKEAAFKQGMLAQNLTTAIEQINHTANSVNNPIIAAQAQQVLAPLIAERAKAESARATAVAQYQQRPAEAAAAEWSHHLRTRVEAALDEATKQKNKLEEIGATGAKDIAVNAAKPGPAGTAMKKEEIKLEREKYSALLDRLENLSKKAGRTGLVDPADVAEEQSISQQLGIGYNKAVHGINRVGSEVEQHALIHNIVPHIPHSTDLAGEDALKLKDVLLNGHDARMAKINELRRAISGDVVASPDAVPDQAPE